MNTKSVLLPIFQLISAKEPKIGPYFGVTLRFLK